MGEVVVVVADAIVVLELRSSCALVPARTSEVGPHMLIGWRAAEVVVGVVYCCNSMRCLQNDHVVGVKVWVVVVEVAASNLESMMSMGRRTEV